ncbi:MAG: VWA domain-containing protein [Bacteroidales bacterium]|nr:VWA domain-containing protein [Bacteroidales bacterium]
MIRFDNPYMLYALVLIPVFVILHVLRNRRKRKLLFYFSDTELFSSLAPDASFKRTNWKQAMFLLAFTFLIIGLANPQVGSRMEKAKRKGVDLVVALDVSNSMLASDIEPNRLENAKRAIERLIKRLDGDRIGLVVFAGKAYTQMPVTTDYAAAQMFLNSVSTDIVPTQGTAIGEAITKGLNALPKDLRHQQAIIIISDGENHEDNAVEMAKKAGDENIIIHTIGMGSVKGAPIPVNSKPGIKIFKKDNKGNTIISQLNQKMLQEIAKAGNGSYITANNTWVGINKLYDEIKKMEEKEFETRIYSDYEDRFQYFIAAALILFILEHLMFNRKSPWLKKLNIFDNQSSNQHLTKQTIV